MYGVLLFWLYLKILQNIDVGFNLFSWVDRRHICDGIKENSLHGLCTFVGYHFLMMMMITQANCDTLNKIGDIGAVDRQLRKDKSFQWNGQIIFTTE